MTTTITKQDVYECAANPCDYFFNGEPITGWAVNSNGISIITEDAFGSTQYNLAWPCVVESTPLKLSSTMLATMLVGPVTPTMTEPAPTEEFHMTAFQVGDTVSMEHLCEATIVGASEEGVCLEVHHGDQNYLVTLPAVFCIHGNDGSFTWTENAVGQVLQVVHHKEYCYY